MSPQPTGTLGLECLIGGQRFALAAESVAQIVEYEVAPLPHAERWVAGLGVLGARVLVSVALVPPAGGRRSTKGLLLNAPSSRVAWALEVGEVCSFVHAQVGVDGKDGAPLGGRDLPAWVTRARTSDGRSIGWVDAEKLLRTLTDQGSLPSDGSG